MLGIDVTQALRHRLQGDQRPPDGKLHPSGDLIGPLRHSQLRAAGAPTVRDDLVGDIRLMTGTMWHSYFEDLYRGQPVMTEVKLDRWLPEGWSGTADWIVWNPEYEAFVLGDLKTIKGEGIKWLKGPKEEHLWQLSAYWYALERMNLPLVRGFGIYYLPMNSVAGEDLRPMLLEAEPLPRDLVEARMASRWADTLAYLTLRKPNEYVTDLLAEPEPRTQKLIWNKPMGVWDVKLVPHWTAQFCPYDDSLCDCSVERPEKVGHYNAEDYVPRKGYEKIEPEVFLTEKELRRFG